jgi:hypothetical protein
MKSKEVERKEMDKMADKVAKKVISSLSNDSDGTNNGNNAAPILNSDINFAFGDNEVNTNDYSDHLGDVIGFDIFDFCEKIVKQGDQIKYEIRKNGEMLAAKVHPYSWERLQKDYGAGSYQVTARSMVTRKYVKHETRAVANIDGVDTPHVRQEEYQQQVQAQPNFMEMFSLMNTLSEKSKTEAREISKEQSNSSNAMMQGFIAMMQNSSTQSQQMFLEMSKLNMNVAEKLSEVTNKMFEKMEDRFEKIVDKIGKAKDNDMGALQLIKLTEDAQKKGFDMFDKISKIAEAKANEKIDMMEETRGNSTRNEKSSIVDKLVDNILPTIANAISEQQKRDTQQARGYLPRPQQRTNAPQAPRFGQRAASAASQASNQSEATQNKTNGAINRTSNGKNNELSNVRTNEFGLPTIEATPVVKQQLNIKEQIDLILIPVIGQCLLKAESPELGAKEIIKTLQENKIPVKLFLDTFQKDDAKQIVEKYSLPVEAIAWFEGVYANIETAS